MCRCTTPHSTHPSPIHSRHYQLPSPRPPGLIPPPPKMVSWFRLWFRGLVISWFSFQMRWSECLTTNPLSTELSARRTPSAPTKQQQPTPCTHYEATRPLDHSREPDLRDLQVLTQEAKGDERQARRIDGAVPQQGPVDGGCMYRHRRVCVWGGGGDSHRRGCVWGGAQP